jgi:predicted Zn finger-like uncharacterized protein
MKFVCDDCGTQYLISDEKVGPKGAKVRCKRCGNIIVVRPGGLHRDDEPDQGVDSLTDRGGAPLPGSENEGDQDELGMAFDQLLKGGIVTGDEDDDEEDEGGATEIFSMEELHRLRSDKDPSDDDHDKIDEVFSRAEGTDIQPNQGDSADQDREEWYVAIEDEQVGPMGLQEVEDRWESGKIKGDSLAWHPGMDDWLPVKDIPKLRYLLGSMKKEDVPDAVATADQAGAASQPGEQWDTSGGSALSSLVEEELQAVESSPPPKEEEEAGLLGEDPGDADEEVAPWEKEEVVSGEVARPSDSFFDSTLDQPTTDSGSPLPAKGRGLARPAYLSGESKTSSKSKYILFGVIGLLVIAGAAAAIVLSGGEPETGPGKVEPLEKPDAGAATDKDVSNATGDKKAADSAKNPEDKKNPSASGDGTTTKPEEKTDAGSSEKKDEGVIVVKKAGTNPKKNHSTNSASSSGKKDPAKRVKRKKKKKVVASKTPKGREKDKPTKDTSPKESTAGLPDTLSKKEIALTMRKYIKAMKGCVQQQQQRDPSVKGTMQVSFVIQGSGKATNVTILSTEHKGTYVAGCIQYLIKNMKFSKFSGNPITVPKVPLTLGR